MRIHACVRVQAYVGVCAHDCAVLRLCQCVYPCVRMMAFSRAGLWMQRQPGGASMHVYTCICSGRCPSADLLQALRHMRGLRVRVRVRARACLHWIVCSVRVHASKSFQMYARAQSCKVELKHALSTRPVVFNVCTCAVMQGGTEARLVHATCRCRCPHSMTSDPDQVSRPKEKAYPSLSNDSNYNCMFTFLITSSYRSMPRTCFVAPFAGLHCLFAQPIRDSKHRIVS